MGVYKIRAPLWVIGGLPNTRARVFGAAAGSSNLWKLPNDTYAVFIFPLSDLTMQIVVQGLRWHDGKISWRYAYLGSDSWGIGCREVFRLSGSENGAPNNALSHQRPHSLTIAAPSSVALNVQFRATSLEESHYQKSCYQTDDHFPDVVALEALMF